jgi:hypothetical protein
VALCLGFLSGFFGIFEHGSWDQVFPLARRCFLATHRQALKIPGCSIHASGLLASLSLRTNLESIMSLPEEKQRKAEG